MKATNTTPETLPCPTCSVKLNHRATVWFLREKSAWELADMTGGATEERVKECAALLDRVQRYGLADVRHWEADQNPRNFGENGEPKPRRAAEEFGLAIRETSLCLWLAGDTKPHKDELKKAGAKWSAKKGAWYFRKPQAA